MASLPASRCLAWTYAGCRGGVVHVVLERGPRGEVNDQILPRSSAVVPVKGAREAALLVAAAFEDSLQRAIARALPRESGEPPRLFTTSAA